MSARLEDFACIVQVTFDRVFDVQGMLFSFESGGKKEYGVSFSDGSVPRSGSRYAVALVEEGNWQRVIGWRDLATTEVVLAETGWDAAWSQASMLYMLAPVFIGAALVFIGPWAALVMLGLFLWLSVWIVRRAVLRNRLVDQALRDVDPPAPPGGKPRIGRTGKTWLTGVLNIFRWWSQ